ncbi:MAG: hypothetical protein A2487_03730 [Candidatus Raymondbacteria bacterium RifOxyC12_full_50_8]|nr:MAG: hypothetical protein A2487_03730 [Candidatus Raymondbacteria bacterium RifOxyC12_full_50_8]
MLKFSVFLLLAAAAFLSIRTEAADVDTLRANVINYMTGAGADTNDPVVAQALTDLENSARNYMNDCQPRGGWPDIDYTISLAYGGEWQAISHYSRMKQMALAYATPGQRLYRSDSIRNAMELALDSIHDLVYSGVSRINNWWYWYQGIPMYYGPALLLMQGHVDSAIFAQASAALKWCLDYPNPPSNPGDMVTQALGNLYYGIVSGDLLYINRARTLAQGELTIHSSYDGIRPDYSCIHHSNQLYIGGYGAQVAADGPRYLLFTRNTSYMLSQVNFDVITNFNAEGTAWCLYHNSYDVSVIGRSITRREGLGGNLTALVLMAVQSGPYQTLFQNAARKALQTFSAALPVEIAAGVSAVKNEGNTASWPLGHKNYWATYFTVHKRPDYHLSVKMMGPGITGSELVNNEGKKSWHLSDGMTYILRNGDEYTTNDVIPTLDWNRLPGITVQKKSYPTGAAYSNSRPFVGGVECGPYGASAMDFSSNGEVLTAKKSWFFFDGELVCLGSDVNCPSTDSAETIVNKRPLSAANAPLVFNGTTVATGTGWSGTITDAAWAACDSIGYYFPGGTDLCGKTANQTGRWSNIGIGDTILRTNPMLTLWMNHGVNAVKASYAYAVLPNKSILDMAVYAASPVFSIVENSDTLHAVSHAGLNAFSAVFWKAGECGLVKADSPSIVFCRITPDSLYFSATYPPRQSATLRFRIDEPLSLVQSTRTMTVSTDSITTILSFASPGTGLGVYAVFHRIPKVFGYARISVHDSATGDPIPGALCSVRKNTSNTGFTDASGIAVVKADTGANQITVQRDGWQVAIVDQVVLRVGETTDVHIVLRKLLIEGMAISPSSVMAGIADTIELTALGLFPDSSADTLTDGLVWSMTPETLGTVDSTGRLVTGWTPGSGSVRCSSTVLGFSTQAALTVRPVYIARPIADAFTRGGTFAGTNYGNDSVLTIKTSDLDYTRRVFLKFDLSNIAGMTVDSAVLKLYSASAVTANISVNTIADDAWQEGSITWSNQPALGSAVDTIVIGNSIGWKYANLTASLQAQAASDSFYSLGLYNPVSDGVYLDFKSRESGAPPVLEVWINPGSMGRASEPDALRAPFLEISPNPFNPTVTMTFFIPIASGDRKSPRLTVFDVKGGIVRSWVLSGVRGMDRIVWNGRDDRGRCVSTGVYVVRLSLANGKNIQKKVILSK